MKKKAKKNEGQTAESDEQGVMLEKEQKITENKAKIEDIKNKLDINLKIKRFFN